MEDEGRETRLTLTVQQDAKYKKMCEWLNLCKPNSSNPFVFVSTKAAGSDQLRWEVQKNILTGPVLSCCIGSDQSHLIRLENSMENSKKVGMKLWSSVFMRLELAELLFLKAASWRTQSILFIDDYSNPKEKDIYNVNSKALFDVLICFLDKNDDGAKLLEQDANGLGDEALFSVIQNIGFDYNKYLGKPDGCIEQPQKRNYDQWIGKISLLAALLLIIYPFFCQFHK